MATCLLRSVINPRNYRAFTHKLGLTSISQVTRRRLHISTIVPQKYFTEKHEWIDVPDGTEEGTVGITDYAQDKLGEIVFVQLPEIGTVLEAEGEAGVLESVKAASDIYSPISGEVTAVNDATVDNPKLINDSPQDQGWLFKATLSNPSELTGLMSEEAYKEYLKTVE